MDFLFQPLCGNDTLWNISLLIKNSWPEFTQCFQWTVLQWIPSLWIWLTFPLHLWYLRFRNTIEFKQIHSSRLNLTKIFICILLIVLALLNIFTTSLNAENSTPPPFALYFTCSLSATTYLLVALLSRCSRKAGLPSPCILFLFWTLNVVCNAVPIYSYIFLNIIFKESTQFCILSASYSLIIIQWFLHFLSERVFPQFDIISEKNESPENSASFPSKITFHWITSYIWKGYRHYLKPEDIWDLPEHFKCQNIVPQFLEEWEREKWKQFLSNKLSSSKYLDSHESEESIPLLKEHRKNSEQTEYTSSLLRVLFKTYAPELFRAHLLRLIADSLQFLLPVLTRSLINFVQSKENHTVWQKYALVVCFFCISFIYSLLFNQNSYRGSCVGMKVKTALIEAVYRKSLTMNNETKRKFTIGTIVNLMSLDCQVLQDVTSNLYVLVSAPFQICIAFYFLNDALGISFIVGVAVIVTLVPLNARISLLAKRAQSEQLKIKDERLQGMSEILTGIKVIKLYAWETTFEDHIIELRKREVKLLQTAAILNIINVFSMLCSPVLVTTLTFISYIYLSSPHSLDSNTAFVSLILFNILSAPMNKLPNIISDLILAHISIKRLKEFLCSEDLNRDKYIRESVNRISYDGNFRQLRLRTEKYAITITSGTFHWDRHLMPILTNINLNIPEGKLVAVVGHIGSGKSSLLSAILGEMEKMSGDVIVKGPVGYLPQEAWIQKMTIKQNILFHRQYHYSRYSRVIKACALQADLEQLSAGDKTEVGESGINLSGGQKQRISLARTVYSEAEVYLLDDPMSALDMQVGKHIFKNVISNFGILKTKTRLLVTHGVHWLPMVDYILVLQQGQIIQSGTYEDLLARDGPFAQLLKNYLLNEDIEDDPEINFIRTEIWKKVDSVTSDGLTSTEEDDRPRRRRHCRHSARCSTADSSNNNSEKFGAESKLTSLRNKQFEEEQSATGKINRNIIWNFVQAYGVSFAIFLLASLIAYQGLSVASNLWLSAWTEDNYLHNITSSNVKFLQSKTFMYLSVYSALGFVQAVCALCFVANISLRMVAAAKHLHNNLLKNIMRQPMSFFQTTPLGRIINRFSRDIDMVDSYMARLVRMFFQQLFVVLSVLGVITYTTPIFIAAALPVMFIYYLIQKVYMPTSRQLRRNESTTKSPIYSHFSETLKGACVIRAFNAVDRFILESQHKVDVNNAYCYAFTSASRWLRIRLELLGNIIVTSAALLTVMTDGLTGSLVGLSISYALQITTALNELVQNSTQLESNIVSVERIVEYSNLPQEPAWIIPFQPLTADWPKSGEIIFQSFSCRHRPDLDLVLKKMSCHIEDGEKIGIVGQTGAGKSSFSMALFRMVDSAGGSIFIDGINIADIGLHQLRSKLTIIPQDPVLFSGSLRFNIDPFELYTDDEIWTTLNFARLSFFISDLPNGLSFICEEGGQNLSVGQRQVVCLIRSLLRHNKIIILDEATAAVDMETDELIQQTIRLCFKDCTVLTIAHRLSTVMDYDRILVLENGKLAEFDTVEKLMINQKSIFYNMVKEANLSA